MMADKDTVYECEPDEETVYEREDESGPSIRLRDGIDLNDLRYGEGTEFEVEMDDVEDDLQQFDPSEIYRCYQDDLADDDADEMDYGLTDFETIAKKMENVTSDGGVKKQMLKEGTGEIISPLSTVTVHYNAYLEFADTPYDSTRLRQRPLTYELGSHQCIEGFELALATMRKNELSRFLIESDYGMGDKGCPPRIPGGATCLYQIEVIHFVECGGAEDYYSIPMSERPSAPYEVMIKVVKKIKAEAKEYFKNGKYHQACKSFQKAANILQDHRMKDEEEEEKQQKDNLELCRNLAVCHLKLKQSGQVIKFSNAILRIEPNSSPAHYYKGKALRMMGEFDRAREELLIAQKLKPGSREIVKELENLNIKAKQFNLTERNMYERMFAKPSQDNTANSVNGKSPEKKKPEKEQGAECSGKLTNDPNAMDELTELFGKQLRLFVDDPELMEVPFSSSSYSPAELNCLADVARSLDLLVLRQNEAQGGKVLLRICKKKPLN